MLQEFYADTMQTTFIKSLIQNTPLPIYNSVRVGDYIVQGMVYVYRSYIIRCTKSGMLDRVVTSGSELAVGDDVPELASYQVLQRYQFGDYIPGITSIHRSATSYYDGDTHRWLGELLRCYKAQYDVDLMPLYNCFNNQVYQDFVLTRGDYVPQDTKLTKIYCVPIKFNTNYFIAIDCSDEVIVQPICRDNQGFLKGVSSQDVTKQLCQYQQIFSGLRFKEPKQFRVDTDSVDLLQYESCLYLAIQLPVSNDSSVVVLECDKLPENTVYNSIVSVNGVDQYLTDVLTKKEQDSLFIADLSLLLLNDKTQHPFASSLIEYLLLNVTTNVETLDKNIEIIQQYIPSVESGKNMTEGVWNDAIRMLLLTRYRKMKALCLDQLGYVNSAYDKRLRSTK